MHQHVAHPPLTPETPTSGGTAASIIDSLSDTLLNAFSKVRKPDERFLEVRDSLDKFEESLVAIERTEARARTRIGGKSRGWRRTFRSGKLTYSAVRSDLASDYEDFAASVQGLGYLESGITDPLARFETSLLDFAQSLRATVSGVAGRHIR